MLLCIARFMDKMLRGSSMSYSQIAKDCGFSEPTAKRCAKKVRERWLRIQVGKGRYVPGKGNENLYDGILPEDLLDELRRRKSGVSYRYPETGEVSQRYPEPSDGVSPGYPETDYGASDRYPEAFRGITQIQAGYQGDTLTPHTPHKEDISREDDPSADAGPGLGTTPSSGNSVVLLHFPIPTDVIQLRTAHLGRSSTAFPPRRLTSTSSGLHTLPVAKRRRARLATSSSRSRRASTSCAGLPRRSSSKAQSATPQADGDRIRNSRRCRRLGSTVAAGRTKSANLSLRSHC
jgi:hypothetical protein